MIYLSIFFVTTGLLWIILSLYNEKNESLPNSLNYKKYKTPKSTPKKYRDNEKFSLNMESPWLKIWYKPRETIRVILINDTTKMKIILVCIGGLASISPFDPKAIELFSIGNSKSDFSLPFIILTLLLSGPIRGLIVFYLGSAILKWTGSFINGCATSEEIESTIAWSNIPIIWSMVLWLPELIQMAPSLQIPYFSIFINSIRIIIGIWTFIIFNICLSEVQKFSVWKSLLNVLLTLLTWAMVALFIFVIVHLLNL